MPTKKPLLSLVLPCYNESEHLAESADRIFDTLNQSKLAFELIFIDDKSKDNTSEIIKNFKKGKKNVRAYYHKKNMGRGATVKEGILISNGIVSGYIDVDLEVSPEYIASIVNTILNNQADVVIGRRHYTINLWPLNDVLRTILSIGYTFLVRLLLHLPVHDTESGYKFFHRVKVLPALKQTQNPHWFWDTEITIQSYLNGLNVQEHDVLFLRREDKTSTVKLVPDTIAFFKALTTFKKSLHTIWNGKSPGLLYRYPHLYSFAMKVLYGNNIDNSYTAVSKLIREKSTVVDLCCGDAKLKSYLKDCHYIGIDSSPSFAFNAIANNTSFVLADVQNALIPEADYIVMQRALYQFDNPKNIIRDMMKKANKAVIIAESISNLGSQDENSIIKGVISMFVGTHTSDDMFRYSEPELKKLLSEYKPKYRYIKGKRDIIAVIYK